MPKNTNLPPETIQEIIALASDMTNVFAPPELIPGCEVLSISDKDQYDTNNGWIEAICGQHNNQRCRWKGKFAGVQVGDYVDVLYFKSAKLFDVLAKGGTGAITPGGGNVWPLAGEANIGATSYATIELMLAALSAGNQGIIGEGSYTASWATGGGRIPTGADVMGSGIDVTNIANTAGASVTLEIEGDSVLENVAITNNVANGYGLALDKGSTSKVHRVKSTASGTGTIAGFFIFSNAGATTAELNNCEGYASGGTNNYAIYVLDSGAGSVDATIRGGYYSGDVLADGNAATIHMDGPTITGSVTEANSGTITGWYKDSSDNIIQLNGDIYPGGESEYPINSRISLGKTVVDEFDGSSLDAAWTGWAAYAGFGTPDVVSFTDASRLRLGFGSTQSGVYGFLYRSVPGIGSYRILVSPIALATNQLVGVRVDDGSLNNYSESFLRQNGSSQWEIVSRYVTGGGGATTTVHKASSTFATTFAVALQIFGTAYTSWGTSALIGINSDSFESYTITSGLSYTPTRLGILTMNPAATPQTFRYFRIDKWMTGF